MKIPRQSFAEAACLYQNDSGKAMVISRPEIGYGRKKPEIGFLDLSSVLMVSCWEPAVKKPIRFVALNRLTPTY